MAEIERRSFLALWRKAETNRHYQRHSLSSAEADWSGKCRFPVPREWHSYATRDKGSRKRLVARGNDSFNLLRAYVPCRKCDQCRRYRRNMWARRAVQEHNSSHRSWMGTLTFPLEMQQAATDAARMRMTAQGLDFDGLSYADQFWQRHSGLSPFVTKWLKRVRANNAAPITYLLVAEAHKSNYPHYHVLLHEKSALSIPKASLEKEWTHGFSHWRLVKDAAQCAYVAKYLGKSTASRVRASIDYGK